MALICACVRLVLESGVRVHTTLNARPPLPVESVESSVISLHEPTVEPDPLIIADAWGTLIGPCRSSHCVTTGKERPSEDLTSPPKKVMLLPTRTVLSEAKLIVRVLGEVHTQNVEDAVPNSVRVCGVK